MQKTSEGKEDVYETFNILMRRKPKENNFKVRETSISPLTIPEINLYIYLSINQNQ